MMAHLAWDRVNPTLDLDDHRMLGLRMHCRSTHIREVPTAQGASAWPVLTGLSVVARFGRTRSVVGR